MSFPWEIKYVHAAHVLIRSFLLSSQDIIAQDQSNLAWTMPIHLPLYLSLAFALPLLAYINVLATPCHTDNMHVETPSYLSRPMRHLTLAVALMAVFVTREAAPCVQRICFCIFHFCMIYIIEIWSFKMAMMYSFCPFEDVGGCVGWGAFLLLK